MAKDAAGAPGDGGDGWPPCPLWDWSLEVYGRDGVAPACLGLQDRRGLDVNVLLLCCRLAAEGHALDRAALGRALDASRRWQAEVVRPLRAARRALKAQLEAGRPAEPARAHAGLAAANLTLYHAFRSDDRPALSALLAGAFPASAPAEIEAALSSIGA